MPEFDGHLARFTSLPLPTGGPAIFDVALIGDPDAVIGFFLPKISEKH
jgi:hypothetical protein